MRFLLCFVMVFLISCKHEDEKPIAKPATIKHVKHVKHLKHDSTYAEKESSRIKRRKQMDLAIQKDSIQMDSLAEIALAIARTNNNRPTFETKYEVMLDSTALPVKVQIRTGYFFEPKKKHVIVEIHDNTDAYHYVFKAGNKSTKRILYHKEWLMTYVNDTIFDVNGDDIKDFCIKWYGSNGCCLKGFYNVYLFKSDENDFTKTFEFINPTFYPKEAIVRNVAYGQPGETEMYKYQWKNRFDIDTIESIYFNPDKKSKMKFVVEKHRRSKAGKKTYFKTIPNEYKSVEAVDWFLGNP